jgi:hypothetical protein
MFEGAVADVTAPFNTSGLADFLCLFGGATEQLLRQSV